MKSFKNKPSMQVRTGNLIMKKIGISICVGIICCVPMVRAQQQFDGICTPVKIKILQELSMERIGFLATRSSQSALMLSSSMCRALPSKLFSLIGA